MIRRVAMLVSTCALLVVTGCGTDSSSSSQNATERLNFTAQTLDGGQLRGDSLRGKPTVLWFWAPWCAKCNREAPEIASVWQANQHNVRFIGVAALDEVPAMKEFVQRNKLGGFSHLNDKDAKVWKRFGVTAQPAYAFIGSNGQVDVVTSELSEIDLKDHVARLAKS